MMTFARAETVTPNMTEGRIRSTHPCYSRENSALELEHFPERPTSFCEGG